MPNNCGRLPLPKLYWKKSKYIYKLEVTIVNELDYYQFITSIIFMDNILKNLNSRLSTNKMAKVI